MKSAGHGAAERRSPRRPSPRGGTSCLYSRAGAEFPRCNARSDTVGRSTPGTSVSIPRMGVKNPPRTSERPTGLGRRRTSTAYEKRWPIGTRQRVRLDVMLYTGLRRGDAVQLGRQHVRDGVVVAQDRENRGRLVTLPILPVPGGDAGGRPVRRSCLHRRRPRSTADEGNLRQRVPGCVPKLQASRAPLTACARSRRPGRPTPARPWRSSRPSSDGRAVRMAPALHACGRTAAGSARERMHTLGNEKPTSIVAP